MNLITQEVPAAPAPRRLAERLPAALLFVFLAALLLAPIWLVPLPPLLDYPNHLARAYILAHAGEHACILDESYAPDWGFYPYLTADVVLVGLQRFFPAETAGRIFLSLAALGIPLAAWFFLRAANPGEDPLALWALLLSHGIYFLYAFLNFYLSLSVLFLALGVWLRWLARPRWSAWCAALAACTVLYFSHLISFGIAGAAVGAYVLLARPRLREIAGSLALFVPGGLFYLRAAFVLAQKQRGLEFRTAGEKFSELLSVLHGYSERLDLWTLAALGGALVAARWRNPEFRWNPRWLRVAAALLGLYAALPVGYGEGWDLDIRVLPVLFVVLFATAQTGRRARWLALVAVAVFCARAVNVLEHFSAAQPEMAGWAESFAVAPRDVRVLPIVEADEDDPLLHPYAHFSAYGVIRRGWFTPYLFDTRGVTPMRIVRDTYTPDGFWDLSYDVAPDWAAVQSDYDYVWAYNVSKYSPQLAEIGELVYESGQLEVYRLKKRPAPEP